MSINIQVKQEDNIRRKAAYEATYPYHIREPEISSPFGPSNTLGIRPSVSSHVIFSPKIKVLPPTRKCQEEEKIIDKDIWVLQYNRRYVEWAQRDQYLQMCPEQLAKENSWRVIFESTFRELSKKRGDSERHIRRANRVKSEYLTVISEDGNPEKSKRNAAVIPSLMTCKTNIQDFITFWNTNNAHSDVAIREKKRLYDFMQTWNDVDINLLRHCLKMVGKNFSNIAIRFPEKTINDCIQCYYLLVKRDNGYKSILPKTKKKMKAKYSAPTLPTPMELANFQRFRNEQHHIMRNNQIHAQLQAQVAQVHAQARVLAQTQALLLNQHLSNIPHSQEMQQLMQIQPLLSDSETSNIFTQQYGLYPQTNIEPVDVLTKFEGLLREIDDFLEHWKFKKSMLAFIPRSPENVKQIYDYLTEHHNQIQILCNKYEHYGREADSFEAKLNEGIVALKAKESTCIQGMSLAQSEISQISAIIMQLQQPYHPGFLLAFPNYQKLLEDNLKHRSQLQTKYATLQAALTVIAAERRKIVEQLTKCAQLKKNNVYEVLNENIQYTSALLSEVSFHGVC